MLLRVRRIKYRRRRRGRRKGFKAKKPLLWICVSLFIVGSVFVLYCWLGGVFRTSDFFNVSKIELTMRPFLKEAMSLDFYGMPSGCNIFDIDVTAISSKVAKRHPEFKSVIILRKPPNVINVRIEHKKPSAHIMARPQTKFFYGKRQVLYKIKNGFALVGVSSDCVILPPDVEPGEFSPNIAGIDIANPAEVGGFCADRKLNSGLLFILALKDYWPLEDYRLKTVDLADLQDASIFLENGIEVKVGRIDTNNSGWEQDIKDKMLSLKKVLRDPMLDLTKIKYVDLRFTDVIIGPKIKKGAKNAEI